MKHITDADTDTPVHCLAGRNGWSCTLLVGHEGDHFATGHFETDPSQIRGYVYDRWAQAGSTKPAGILKTTVADRVLETLRIADEPLTQCQIADRSGDNAASVRRTVQELRTNFRLVVADYAGIQQSPRFLLPA